MKKLLIFTTFLLVLNMLVYSQYDSSKARQIDQNLKQRLILKSKRQATAAWILLGSGVALNAIGFAFHPRESDDFATGFDKALFAGVLHVAGIGAIATGVPLLIISGHNRRKAALMVDTGQLQLAPHLMASRWQLKTGVAITF